MKNSSSSGKFQVRQESKRLELPSEVVSEHKFGARININQDGNNNSVLVNKIDSALLDIRSTLIKEVDSMLLDIRSAFSIAIKEIENPFVEVMDIIREKNKNFYLQIQELAPSIEKFFLVINELEKELPEKVTSVLYRLGEKGWYPYIGDLPFDFFYKLEEILDTITDDELNELIKIYFVKRVESIEEDLVSRFPHRANIISEAFDAHNTGKYNLSIPVFLSQADGIHYEITGKKDIYGKNKLGIGLYDNKKQKASQKVKDLTTDSFEKACLHLLTVPLSICISEQDIPEHFSGLHRHTILHGKSLNYGTEINSLRAISLLSYVSSASEILEDQKQY